MVGCLFSYPLLKGDVLMSNSKFQHYFDELDVYLDLKDLADSTRVSYHYFLNSYLTWISETLAVSPDEATYADIRNYIIFLKKIKKLSNHSINAYTSQIRFFRTYVLKQGWDPNEVPHMRYNTKLPFVLSKKDALTFIDTIPNLKHKAFICLLYSSGLRVSEVCSLRYEDISRENRRIFILNSKNRADRYALLSPKALDILIDYWNTHGKPKGWLFPGLKPDTHIVKYTANLYIKRHIERLGWTYPITAHTFRHSFATHLYEQGLDLLSIQKHLGHRSINSTAVYIHLARTDQEKVISPYDIR